MISKIKDLFNKNIECSCDCDDYIVFPYKKNKIYLNKNIIVRDGTACVVVYKNKICDTIYPGKYKIHQETIPETFARARLDDNKKIKKIKSRLYFVNTKEFNDFEFVSDVAFKSKSFDLGKVKGCLKGRCCLKVIEAGALIKMLYKYGRFNSKSAQNIISMRIGNRINKQIEKSKIPVNAILLNQSQVEMHLNTDLENAFDKIGIFIKNIKLKAVDFNKKHQEKINKFLATKKKLVKPNLNASNIDNNNGRIPVLSNVRERSAMQNLEKPLNINTFILSRNCGNRNNITNKICAKCGKKL